MAGPIIKNTATSAMTCSDQSHTDCDRAYARSIPTNHCEAVMQSMAAQDEGGNQNNLTEYRDAEELPNTVACRPTTWRSSNPRRYYIVRNSTNPDAGEHQEGRLQYESGAEAESVYRLACTDGPDDEGGRACTADPTIFKSLWAVDRLGSSQSERVGQRRGWRERSRPKDTHEENRPERLNC
jgi:hypothetical protein